LSLRIRIVTLIHKATECYRHCELFLDLTTRRRLQFTFLTVKSAELLRFC